MPLITFEGRMSVHSLEKFTFAAIYVFLPSVPLTHSLGLIAHCPPAARARHILLYPMKGGRHHFIFQVIAWVSCLPFNVSHIDAIASDISQKCMLFLSAS